MDTAIEKQTKGKWHCKTILLWGEGAFREILRVLTRVRCENKPRLCSPGCKLGVYLFLFYKCENVSERGFSFGLLRLRFSHFNVFGNFFLPIISKSHFDGHGICIDSPCNVYNTSFHLQLFHFCQYHPSEEPSSPSLYGSGGTVNCSQHIPLAILIVCMT